MPSTAFWFAMCYGRHTILGGLIALTRCVLAVSPWATYEFRLLLAGLLRQARAQRERRNILLAQVLAGEYSYMQ